MKYVQSQPNSIPLGLKFYKTRGNNGIVKISVRNFPKTDSAKYLCNAIISIFGLGKPWTRGYPGTPYKHFSGESQELSVNLQGATAIAWIN